MQQNKEGKLEWWSVEMSYQSGPTKRTTVCGRFLAKDGMEALKKGERWMAGEGITEYSMKIVGDAVPLGELHGPQPVINKEAIDTETGEITVEKEIAITVSLDTSKLPKEKVVVPLDIKRHFFLYPINVETKPYTYKEGGL